MPRKRVYSNYRGRRTRASFADGGKTAKNTVNWDGMSFKSKNKVRIEYVLRVFAEKLEVF